MIGLEYAYLVLPIIVPYNHLAILTMSGSIGTEGIQFATNACAFMSIPTASNSEVSTQYSHSQAVLFPQSQIPLSPSGSTEKNVRASKRNVRVSHNKCSVN